MTPIADRIFVKDWSHFRAKEMPVEVDHATSRLFCDDNKCMCLM